MIQAMIAYSTKSIGRAVRILPLTTSVYHPSFLSPDGKLRNDSKKGAAVMRSKLALTLLLAGALFTMGAKWAETPIQDFNSIAGAWKGTYIKDGKKYPVSLNIKEDGSYEGEDWQGPLKGKLTIKEGRIQYQGGEQHHFTLTLQQRKKKRLLKGVDERGEFQVSLKPAKTKRVKRKRKKKTKLSLKEAKEITASFEALAFTPPPRNITDITAILTQDKPEDLESYKQTLALADHNPPATNDVQELVEFYFRRAQAAHEVGRARQEIEDYHLAVKYGKESGFQYLPRAMWNLGTAEIRGGNFSRGIKLHKASLANETRAGVLSGRGAALASDYARIGDLKAAKRQLARAEQSYVKFVRRASGQILALNTAVLNTARAGVLEATGRLAEAEGYHLRAVAKWEPYKDLPVKAMSASMDSKTGLRVFNWVVARAIPKINVGVIQTIESPQVNPSMTGLGPKGKSSLYKQLFNKFIIRRASGNWRITNPPCIPNIIQRKNGLIFITARSEPICLCVQ